MKLYIYLGNIFITGDHWGDYLENMAEECNVPATGISKYWEI